MAPGMQPDPLQNPSLAYKEGRPDPGPGGGQRPADRGAGIAESAKAQAQAVWTETRESVRSSVAQQQHAAAERLGDVAGALRSAAQQLGGQRQDAVASVADYAAEGLEHLSQTLRSRDLDTLVRDAESLARRQPVLFFGAAVAAGFLAIRFVKSSRDRRESATNTPASDLSGEPGTPLHPGGGQLH